MAFDYFLTLRKTLEPGAPIRRIPSRRSAQIILRLLKTGHLLASFRNSALMAKEQFPVDFYILRLRLPRLRLLEIARGARKIVCSRGFANCKPTSPMWTFFGFIFISFWKL
jgi:hypothetical protein